MFLINLFEEESCFVRLKQLYIEQNCEMTYWMQSKIKKIRPFLQIRMNPNDNSWMNKIEISLE